MPPQGPYLCASDSVDDTSQTYAGCSKETGFTWNDQIDCPCHVQQTVGCISYIRMKRVLANFSNAMRAILSARQKKLIHEAHRSDLMEMEIKSKANIKFHAKSILQDASAVK